MDPKRRECSEELRKARAREQYHKKKLATAESLRIEAEKKMALVGERELIVRRKSEDRVVNFS